MGPKNRSNLKWTDELRAQFEAFEGVPVRAKGFLVAEKPQTGCKEATNCRFTKAAETVWHVALSANAGDGENEIVVIETVPRIQRTIRNGRRRD